MNWFGRRNEDVDFELMSAEGNDAELLIEGENVDFTEPDELAKDIDRVLANLQGDPRRRKYWELKKNQSRQGYLPL